MRLGQLARKLNLSPSDVVAALPPGSVLSEYNSNIRLTDEQVREVIQFFRPDNWSTLLQEYLEEDILEIAKKDEVPAAKQSGEMPAPDTVLEEPVNEENKPELIKAPKIALPGLKVVGKIELPEKPPKTEANLDEPAKPEPAFKRRTPRLKNDQRQGYLRHRKNPVALAREREQRELEKQKQLEAEQEKQKRTQKYHAKVSGYKRVKPVKPTAKRVVQSQPVTSIQQPATLWGKFKKWLFRE